MNKMTILFVLLTLTSCAGSGARWNKEEKALEAAYLTLHVIDWGQTRYVAKHPEEYRERNPILGQHPSTEQVDTYFIATALLHPLVTHYLPRPYRRWWQAISITMGGACVINNASVGVKWEF
jgi:hypothetical protein